MEEVGLIRSYSTYAMVILKEGKLYASVEFLPLKTHALDSNTEPLSTWYQILMQSQGPCYLPLNYTLFTGSSGEQGRRGYVHHKPQPVSLHPESLSLPMRNTYDCPKDNNLNLHM